MDTLKMVIGMETQTRIKMELVTLVMKMIKKVKVS